MERVEEVGSELTNSVQEAAIGAGGNRQRESVRSLRETLAGSWSSQWPPRAGVGARAHWGSRSCRREVGGGERAGAPRSSCRRCSHRRSEEAMLCGVWGGGEEEEGVKPSKETGETPHTAQDGRRGSSNPSCQAARRGLRARRCAGSSIRASRRVPGKRGGRGRGEAAARGCESPRQRRPRRPGLRRPWLRCGSGGGDGARGRVAARAVGYRLRRATCPGDP